MKKFKEAVKKVGLIFVAVSVIFATPAVSVYGEDVSELSPEDTAALVKEVVEHLSIYARYDDVSQASLYREGLLNAIKEHPEIYESVMNGILSSIDEHSEYYNSSDTVLLQNYVTGTIVGIGVTFQMCEDGVDVVSVIPDTPAEKAGIKVGDVIVSADDISLVGMNSDTAASYIRGEEGSSLRVGVKREGEDSIIYLNMVREKIIGTSVKSKVYEDGDNKAMYIRVYGFISNTAECFKKELDSAAEQGIDNIIIDVRDNGGGMFDQAIKMADYIVPKGSLITVEDHKITMLNKEYYAEEEDAQKYNTIVLMNENSASASEVLTAALAENDCAYKIGNKSYGKGTIQTIIGLPGNDSMKYTVGYYLTPKRNNINGIGIQPDLHIENTEEDFDMSSYPEYGYIQVYSEGDSGDEIKMTKELLSVWGSYTGEIDSVYDKALSNAVYKFQAQTGLYPYGVLDYTTQHELYTRIKISKVVHDDQLDEALIRFGIKNIE